jgi:hypothetical protein
VKISSSYFKSVLSRFEINIAVSLSGKRKVLIDNRDPFIALKGNNNQVQSLWYLCKLHPYLPWIPMACSRNLRRHWNAALKNVPQIHRRGRLFAPNRFPPAAKLCLTIISAAAAAARRSLCLLLSLRYGAASGLILRILRIMSSLGSA